MLHTLTSLFIIIATSLFFSSSVKAELQAIDIYSVKQLSELIKKNEYLQQVKRDDCQLVQDIEAKAEVLKEPLYQFLWGEMLNTGTCIKADKKRGMTLVLDSANQGSNGAMYRLARYYDEGDLVIENKDRAIQYALPAAAGEYVPAQMMLVRLFIEGHGSPFDYEMSYRLLYHNTFDDNVTKNKAEKLLRQLAKKMPQSVVERAQRGKY
ncbi:tetratricopeptide repeat protein [Parashewanella hymeniacidonis]|uniref:tetratricopeptide repeat protein n=1 Tax=Parashewanella hymeniacidonis TaxID=2807618 RepID=UPI001EF6C6D5|nr:flagellar protein MotX [Parashewanella hymeniacidonis]